MKPALPTACSNLTPSDSHTPTIDRGLPTEIISDSSSASVRSPSTRLLASLLTTASRKLGRPGGADQYGTLQHPGLLRNCPHDHCSRLPRLLSPFSSFHQARWTIWLSSNKWCIYNFIHESHYYCFNFYYDQFVCQQWRHHDISSIHWGNKLKFPQF